MFAFYLTHCRSYTIWQLLLNLYVVLNVSLILGVQFSIIFSSFFYFFTSPIPETAMSTYKLGKSPFVVVRHDQIKNFYTQNSAYSFCLFIKEWAFLLWTIL